VFSAFNFRSYLLCGFVGLALLVPPAGASADQVKFLYKFQGGSDGAFPSNGLIMDKQGNFYGTTLAGGSENCSYGCGTIFELAANGTQKILYYFQGGSDGSSPSGLLRDDKGNLYGTTSDGGASNYGTIFELSPGGTKQILYAFQDGADGAYPSSPLMRDKAGSLFGVAAGGGVSKEGTIFKLAREGSLSVLYSFCSKAGCADGSTPQGALLRDTAGNFYGTTYNGGTVGSGTVFKLSASGQESVLYSFCVQNYCPDGANPEFGVTMDPAGNLYGTTSAGGNFENNAFGVVFKVTPDGVESVLHNFTYFYDGARPLSGLLLDRGGYLYGTLEASQACHEKGTPVYRLAMDGTEKLYCVRNNKLFGNVIERNGYLYGVGGEGIFKENYGVVFAVKK